MIGGATKSLLALAHTCKQEGFDVTVLFFRSNGNAFSMFKDNSLKYEIFSRGRVFQHAYGAYIPIFQKKFYRSFLVFLRSILSIRSTKKFISEFKPDLVYLNTSLLFPSAIACKILGVKTIWHLREQIHPGLLGVRKLWLRICFKYLPDKVISISKTNAFNLNIKREVSVIYNSILIREVDRKELTKFRNDYRLGDKPLIAFLGGSVSSKGADLLVKSIISLFKIRDNFQLVIAGEFERFKIEQMNDIEKEVHSLLSNNIEVKKHIVFTGPLKDVQPLLQNSTILVWPATVPHFSRPVMEAMSLGKAVLASDFKSTREIVDDGIDGVLFSPDVSSLTSSLACLLDNPEKIKSLGKKAKVKGKNLFNQNINLRENLNIINSLILD